MNLRLDFCSHSGFAVISAPVPSSQHLKESDHKWGDEYWKICALLERRARRRKVSISVCCGCVWNVFLLLKDVPALEGRSRKKNVNSLPCCLLLTQFLEHKLDEWILSDLVVWKPVWIKMILSHVLNIKFNTQIDIHYSHVLNIEVSIRCTFFCHTSWRLIFQSDIYYLFWQSEDHSFCTFFVVVAGLDCMMSQPYSCLMNPWSRARLTGTLVSEVFTLIHFWHAYPCQKRFSEKSSCCFWVIRLAAFNLLWPYAEYFRIPLTRAGTKIWRNFWVLRGMWSM